jgi:2,3-diketo-5-methylthio-1-phosphopentane phosphatase
VTCRSVLADFVEVGVIIEKMVVLCDFDGTITEVDTAEFVLCTFAHGDWRTIEALFEKGEITLEECLRRQFSLVRASRTQMLNALEGVATFRPGFEEFARHCKGSDIPLVIVSAGLDFVIEHFLKVKDFKDLVTVYMPKTRITADGIGFKFPRRYFRASVDSKHDLVRHYKGQSFTVIFIGDGSADFAAAKEANLAFAIKGSRLEELCGKEKIPFKSIGSFLEVLESMRKM